MAERLYRSRTDRMIGGVAGGIAAAFNLDPSLVRVGWVVLALVTSGAAILVYFVMLFVVPEEPEPGALGSTHAPGAEPRQADAGATQPAWDARAPDTEPGAAPPGAALATSEPARPGFAAAGNGPLILGVLLILVGAWFLLRQLLPRFDFGALWPVVALGLGVVLVVLSLRGERRP